MVTPDPAAPTPRVLGVDDFAIRRGQNYGTVLIDCETGAPLELLEGRDAGPLALLADGHGIRTIARHLGWGRHTVQRYARAATWQELVDGRWQAPRPSKLDPFKPHLHQRAGEGCGNAAQLFREIRALGYDGSYSTVRDYLDQNRPEKAPLTPPPPTVRDVTGWLTRRPDSLTEDEQPQLKALLARCPELQAASGHIRTFATMLARLTGQDHLPQWITDVKNSEL